MTEIISEQLKGGTERQNITGIAKNILQDGTILPEEAKILGSYLHERGQISKEGRKNWSELSYEIRKDIQEKIGVSQDGAIGAQTINALQKLTEKQEIQQGLSEVAHKTKQTGDIILATQKNPQTITEKQDIEVISPAPNYIAGSFFHRNDSTFHNNGRDTGDSFAFGGEIKNADWKVQSYYNGFTAGEYVTFDNGEKIVHTENATRLDSIQGSLQKSIYSEYFTDGSYVNMYVGGGIQKVGDLGGDEVQNAWHELGGWYKHNGKYENISKVTGTLNASIEGKKYFSTNTDFKPFFEGNIDLQKSLDADYGTDSLGAKIKAGVDYENLTVGAYSNYQKRMGVNTSDTINQAYKSEQNTYNGVFAEYRDGKLSYNAFYSPDELGLGIKYKF